MAIQVTMLPDVSDGDYRMPLERAMETFQTLGFSGVRGNGAEEQRLTLW